ISDVYERLTKTGWKGEELYDGEYREIYPHGSPGYGLLESGIDALLILARKDPAIGKDKFNHLLEFIIAQASRARENRYVDQAVLDEEPPIPGQGKFGEDDRRDAFIPTHDFAKTLVPISEMSENAVDFEKILVEWVNVLATRKENGMYRFRPFSAFDHLEVSTLPATLDWFRENKEKFAQVFKIGNEIAKFLKVYQETITRIKRKKGVRLFSSLFSLGMSILIRISRTPEEAYELLRFYENFNLSMEAVADANLPRGLDEIDVLLESRDPLKSRRWGDSGFFNLKSDRSLSLGIEEWKQMLPLMAKLAVVAHEIPRYRGVFFENVFFSYILTDYGGERYRRILVPYPIMIKRFEVAMNLLDHIGRSFTEHQLWNFPHLHYFDKEPGSFMDRLERILDRGWDYKLVYLPEIRTVEPEIESVGQTVGTYWHVWTVRRSIFEIQPIPTDVFKALMPEVGEITGTETEGKIQTRLEALKKYFSLLQEDPREKGVILNIRLLVRSGANLRGVLNGFTELFQPLGEEARPEDIRQRARIAGTASWDVGPESTTVRDFQEAFYEAALWFVEGGRENFERLLLRFQKVESKERTIQMLEQIKAQLYDPLTHEEREILQVAVALRGIGRLVTFGPRHGDIARELIPPLLNSIGGFRESEIDLIADLSTEGPHYGRLHFGESVPQNLIQPVEGIRVELLRPLLFLFEVASLPQSPRSELRGLLTTTHLKNILYTSHAENLEKMRSDEFNWALKRFVSFFMNPLPERGILDFEKPLGQQINLTAEDLDNIKDFVKRHPSFARTIEIARAAFPFRRITRESPENLLKLLELFASLHESKEYADGVPLDFIALSSDRWVYFSKINEFLRKLPPLVALRDQKIHLELVRATKKIYVRDDQNRTYAIFNLNYVNGDQAEIDVATFRESFARQLVEERRQWLDVEDRAKDIWKDYLAELEIVSHDPLAGLRLAATFELMNSFIREAKMKQRELGYEMDLYSGARLVKNLILKSMLGPENRPLSVWNHYVVSWLKGDLEETQEMRLLLAEDLFNRAPPQEPQVFSEQHWRTFQSNIAWLRNQIKEFEQYADDFVNRHPTPLKFTIPENTIKIAARSPVNFFKWFELLVILSEHHERSGNMPVKFLGLLARDKTDLERVHQWLELLPDPPEIADRRIHFQIDRVKSKIDIRDAEGNIYADADLIGDGEELEVVASSVSTEARSELRKAAALKEAVGSTREQQAEAEENELRRLIAPMGFEGQLARVEGILSRAVDLVEPTETALAAQTVVYITDAARTTDIIRLLQDAPPTVQIGVIAANRSDLRRLELVRLSMPAFYQNR
ncbi:MAG: hypothetical protein HY351_04550, partial [Candidatus Omnitrophica bacterium]|nr:hypothetical protein [Candidatus Omnitrophota bacterium]